MSEKIEPALNPHEWEYVTRSDSFVSSGGIRLYLEENYGIRIDESPAKIAALALYGQPFGFTREDVQLLNDVAYRLDHVRDEQERLDALAERINALLPPREMSRPAKALAYLKPARELFRTLRVRGAEIPTCWFHDTGPCCWSCRDDGLRLIAEALERVHLPPEKPT